MAQGLLLCVEPGQVDPARLEDAKRMAEAELGSNTWAALAIIDADVLLDARLVWQGAQATAPNAGGNGAAPVQLSEPSRERARRLAARYRRAFERGAAQIWAAGSVQIRYETICARLKGAPSAKQCSTTPAWWTRTASWAAASGQYVCIVTGHAHAVPVRCGDRDHVQQSGRAARAK